MAVLMIGFGVDGSNKEKQQDFEGVRGDFVNNPFVTAVQERGGNRTEIHPIITFDHLVGPCPFQGIITSVNQTEKAFHILFGNSLIKRLEGTTYYSMEEVWEQLRPTESKGSAFYTSILIIINLGSLSNQCLQVFQDIHRFQHLLDRIGTQ